MLSQTIRVLAVAGLATAAQADVLFSFASDTDHTGSNFKGFGTTVEDQADGGDPLVLLIDDDNGPLSPLTYDVEFDADFAIDYAGSVNLGGGLFVHTYGLSGEFGFYDQNGSPVLTATVSGGALTALGSADRWMSAASILSADGSGIDVVYNWHLADNAAYGLYNGLSVGPDDDAAFTLTDIFTLGNGLSGVDLDSGMLPESEWYSEGSFSGSASFVPAPGSLALLAGTGLLLGRRRR